MSTLITVTAKNHSGVTHFQQSEITLKGPSVVQIKLDHSQIKKEVRVGADLVLTTISGEHIVIHGFFAAQNSLVLQDENNSLWLFNFTDAPGEQPIAYVLTTESETNVANANKGNGIVGTGYNDTFFATRGTDIFDGGGGTVDVSGVKSWSNTGGMDIVDYKLAGNTNLTIDLSISGPQDTGFGTATFKNIEGLAGGSGNDTFTGSATVDGQFEGRGGNDTFNLAPAGGRDTLLYKVLVAADGTGGNGSDVVNGFHVGTYEATPTADRIDLKDLLVGYAHDADGAAHYINGVATIDAGDSIAQFLKVTNVGGNTVVSIDRDGSGGAYTSTVLVTLNGVTTDLATLLANHQLVI